MVHCATRTLSINVGRPLTAANPPETRHYTIGGGGAKVGVSPGARGGQWAWPLYSLSRVEVLHTPLAGSRTICYLSYVTQVDSGLLRHSRAAEGICNNRV